MSVARGSIDKSLFTWILMLGLLLGGVWGFFTVGRLEDPAFTIKSAVIVTQYPGATAAQVAREVSEPLESAIQKLAELDSIVSRNEPGLSTITIEIKSTYGGDELPGIWTKLRNRVGDAAGNLPDGVRPPMVNDSFGDVFGLFYAVSAEGFTDAERHQVARFLRRELLAVEGVADVEVAGLPDEVIYVDANVALAYNQNIPATLLTNAIATANSVTPAGNVNQDGRRTRITNPEGSDSVDEIAGLTVGVGGQLVNLFDIATVYRGRKENPAQMIRHNGVEAFTLGVSGLSSANIVEVGQRVDARLAELESEIPVGVNLQPVYQQHVIVDEASSAFLVNLAMSVAIVVTVLALFMGWRAGVVVGATLVLSVIGTLFFMALFSIEMERISLGALIIAMGMLVDNAIVVAEGMQVQMAAGRSARDAAQEVGGKTQTPLVGATVIGIMAFAGIGLSPDATGEFLFSLFAVIAISLLLSWVLALTATPLLGHYFFKIGAGTGDHDPYGGRIFRAYAGLLRVAIRLRWLVVMLLIAVTVAGYAGFASVKQQFFPDSNTPLFFVNYKLPQGSTIAQTSADMAVVEKWLLERDDVSAVTTFVGAGATRFMLTYAPGDRDASYGHLIVRTENLEAIPALRADLDAFGAAMLPAGEFRTERLVFGPGGGAPIAARFSGPDPKVLRALGEEASRRMQAASDNLLHLRTNWREPELVLRPIYASDRAQSAGVPRDLVANALTFATDGLRAGTYRDQDRLIPIIVRPAPGDNLTMMDQILGNSAGDKVALQQVVDGMGFEVQDTLIWRRNRVQTLTVESDIVAGVTNDAAQREITATVEAMELPVGYTLEWGGDLENSSEAQQSLGRQLPLSFLVMVMISVLLFGALRQPLVIWLLVPMSVNGVVIGLLGTGLPFTFTALLGLLSLSGMLLKNGIVLVEEIDLVRATGMPFDRAVVEACTSRLRPVMLAAVTTILGMVPLLGDAFFASMAVTIMGGLAFATVLTLVAAPVFYVLLFHRERRAKA
jgi:multidrug efflux pump subunit AcrB